MKDFCAKEEKEVWQIQAHSLLIDFQSQKILGFGARGRRGRDKNVQQFFQKLSWHGEILLCYACMSHGALPLSVSIILFMVMACLAGVLNWIILISMLILTNAM